MRNFCHRSVALCIVSFALLLFAQPVGALVLRGYFPVAQGNFWNYSRPDNDLVDTWAVNGSFWLKGAGRVIILQQNNGFICLKEDWEGLRIYGEYYHDRYYVPDTPVMFLPRELDANSEAAPLDTTVTLKVFTDADGWKNFKKTGEETRRIQFRITGFDDVTIGSKLYKECVVIEKTAQGPEGVAVEKMWLAPNIGPVKRCVTFDKKQTTYTLASASGKEPVAAGDCSLRDYLPVQPGTVWTYKDPAGNQKKIVAKEEEKAKLMNVSTTPLVEYTDDVYYVGFDVRGLVLYQRFWKAFNGMSTFSSPEQAGVFLPAGLTAGTFHSSRTYPRSYVMPSMRVSLTYPAMNISSIVLCKEDVTVPAGSYKDCLKVCMFFLPETPTLQFEYLSAGHVWLAKGIGIVKQNKIEIMNCALSESENAIWEERTWELVSIEKPKSQNQP